MTSTTHSEHPQTQTALTSTASWNDLETLPVFKYLTEPTRTALQANLEQGHPQKQQQRTYRWVQFFKALDWLPLHDIQPSPVKYLTPADQQCLMTDVRQYLDEKQSQKQKRRDHQKSYRLRLIEYFQQEISGQDKILLEQLRDYELNTTGQDANWQHYFRFTSFKQIDAFNQLDIEDRQELMEAFRRDVQTRHYHEKRLEEGRYWGFYNDETPPPIDETWAPAKQSTTATATQTPQQKAYAILELNESASAQSVRQQFRRLTLKHHPDRPGGSAETMKSILWAYQLLTNERDD